MKSQQILFFVANLTLILITSTQASQFDPHLPRGSPWFEGWYMRVVDVQQQIKAGFIFGAYPQQQQQNNASLVLVSLLVETPTDAQPQVKSWFPHINDVSITVGNQHQPVTQDPDYTTPPNFCWQAINTQLAASFCANGDRHTLNYRFVDGTYVSANFSAPTYWNTDGTGPEGWVSRLGVLGLNWFVFSLHSQVDYQIVIPSLSLSLSGQGIAHQEKNWGTSFPNAWIWGQGFNDNDSNHTQFAFAGGPTHVLGVDVTAYLVGYRSATLDWSFHPQDIGTMYNVNRQPCQGSLNLTASDATRILFIELIPANGYDSTSYSDVECPTNTGFLSDSVESFTMNAYIRASKRTLFGEQLIEEAFITNAALEFGGDYRCGY